MDDFDSEVKLPECFSCYSLRKSLNKMKNGEILQKIVSSIGVNYSRLQVRTLKWGYLQNIQSSVEITRQIADLPGNADSRAPSTCASICIYELGSASFCVNGCVEETFRVFEEDTGRILFDNLADRLQRLQTFFGFCSGIPLEEYQNVCRHVRQDPKYLLRESLCMRDKKCLKWLRLKNNLKKEEKEAIASGKYRCTECSSAYRKSRKREKSNAALSPTAIKKRTSASSTYPFSQLSPNSKDERFKDLCRVHRRDYNILRRYQQKSETLYNVEFDDEHGEELGQFTEDQLDEAIWVSEDPESKDEEEIMDKKEAMRNAFFDDHQQNPLKKFLKMPKRRRSILPGKSMHKSVRRRKIARARVSAGNSRADDDDDVPLSVLATRTRNDTSINSVQNLQSCGLEYDSLLSDPVTLRDSRTSVRVDDDANQGSLDMNSRNNTAPASYLANNSVSTVLSIEIPPTRLPATCSSVGSAPPSHVSSLKDCTPHIKTECVFVEEDSCKEFHETENERVEQFNRESASNDQTSPESETRSYRIHNSAQGLFIDTDLILPYMDWVVKHETNGDVRLIKLSETTDTLLCKVVITVSKAEPYLNIIVHQKEIPNPTHDIYSKYGGKPLSNKEIGKMVEEINSYGICIGNPDPEFKTSCPKSGLACIEIDFGEECDQSTIISAKCHLLFNAGPRCPNCCSLRTSLRATASRKRRRTDNLEDPLIHMSREQLQNHLKTISSENKCLKKRICQLSNALASIKKIVLSNADWEGITNIKEANMSGIHETAVIGSLALDNIKQEHFETDINNISHEEGFLKPIEEDSGELCSPLNNTEHVVKEESRDDMSVENTNMFVASELDLVCSDDAD